MTRTQRSKSSKTRRGTAIARLRKLSVADGDVIVVKAKERGLDSLSSLTEEILDLKEFLAKTGRPNCCIILLGPEATIEQLTPKEMLSLGWAKVQA